MKVFLSITDDYSVGFEARQSPPSGPVLTLSGAMRTMIAAICQTLETYFNPAYVKVLNLVTGIGSHTSAYPCDYFISACKPSDPDAPLRTLNLDARQFDK